MPLQRSSEVPLHLFLLVRADRTAVGMNMKKKLAALFTVTMAVGSSGCTKTVYVTPTRDRSTA